MRLADLCIARDIHGDQQELIGLMGPVDHSLHLQTGVNVVMYALTGNYKADQVHIPALLERLGQ